MANKTFAELSSLTTSDDDDLIGVYDTSAAILKKQRFDAFLAQCVAGLGSAFLTAASNLSDLASAATARVNLGLGSVATLASSAVFQVANSLSEVTNAATARSNLGAAAANAPTITSGMTYSGATKQNVNAVASTAIDWSLAEFHTKSISANTTFTFTEITASKAQAVILDITISSAAVPTWPAAVKWTGGVAPTLGNGRHIVGFMTDDGGTTVVGVVGATSVA